MFDFFRKHTWLLQVVLAFVVIAFVNVPLGSGLDSSRALRNAARGGC